MSIKVSEIFYSAQGEGIRTGVLSAWVRFAACNLRCKGFFQDDPSKPDTYKDPLNGIAPKEYKSLAELPVMHYGCDTIYAIDPRFKHLFKDYTVDEISNEVKSLLPNGTWTHPKTNNDIDLCFTGGEPMLQQSTLIGVCSTLKPTHIQIETNGTKRPEPSMLEWYMHGNFTLHWNISPKLFYVSGEPDHKAWCPDVIFNLWHMSSCGCLKFVINNDDRAWDELNNKVAKLAQMGVKFPIYIMPAGATYDQQTDVEYLSKIATRAVNEGYHLSSRLQSIFWGNSCGV